MGKYSQLKTLICWNGFANGSSGGFPCSVSSPGTEGLSPPPGPCVGWGQRWGASSSRAHLIANFTWYKVGDQAYKVICIMYVIIYIGRNTKSNIPST